MSLELCQEVFISVTGQPEYMLAKVSSPDFLEDPSLFLINVFLIVTVTVNGDSTMLKFKFDFLM